MEKKTSSKSKLLGVVALVIVAAGVVGVSLSNRSSEPVKPATTSQSSQKAQEPAKYLTYQGVEGKNALELLKSEATVVTKTSSIGEYVDSVNGLVGGTDGQYWSFYVNGQLSQVGAGMYTTKANDKIEWKFEKFE